jgi:hypothetical protein
MFRQPSIPDCVSAVERLAAIGAIKIKGLSLILYKFTQTNTAKKARILTALAEMRNYAKV